MWLFNWKDRHNEIVEEIYVEVYFLPSSEIELFLMKDCEYWLYIYSFSPRGFGYQIKCIIPTMRILWFERIAQLINSIQNVRNTKKKNLIISIIILTMYDRNNSLSSIITNDVRSHLKNMIFDSENPLNVRINKASSHDKTVILLYFYRSSIFYLELGGEFLVWEKKRNFYQLQSRNK